MCNKVSLDYLRLFVVAIEGLDRDISGSSGGIIGVGSGEEEDVSRGPAEEEVNPERIGLRRDRSDEGPKHWFFERRSAQATGGSRDGLLRQRADRETVCSVNGRIERSNEGPKYWFFVRRSAPVSGSRDLSTVKDG